MESTCCSFQLNEMKKTMAAATAAALLLCFCISASADDCGIHKATGEEVTLSQKYPQKIGRIIQWRRNSRTYAEVMGSKERCCDGSGKQIKSDGSLLLTKLTKANSGTYEPSVFDDGQPMSGLKSIILCVLDRVPKPIVNVTCNDNQKPALKCIVPEPNDGYKYKWLHNNKEVTKQISQDYAPRTLEGDFHCLVYNPVSEQKSDVVSSPCVDSGFVFPDMLFGISIWFFVAAGGGIVLVLIVVILCCCIRNRRRKRMHIKDEEEYRLRFTMANQQQQQQHHPHHHHHHHHPNQQQRQPPGHTGPRQHRPKGAKGPEPPSGQPRPSPRRTAQGPRPVGNDEDPPPLPQPRKKVAGQRA